MDAQERESGALTALQSLLAAARAVVDELADEPIVARMKAAFASLPEADRAVICGVLERDAAWCRIVAATADTTGIRVHPNPHASLYVHVLDDAAPSQRDLDVVRVGIERFITLLPLLFQEGVHAQWIASARALVGLTDPALRALCLRLAREVTALIEETPPA